jgi:hypothetical protein
MMTKRIVLYKEIGNGNGTVDLQLVDFGVLSKIDTYKKLGYVIVEWIQEVITDTKKIAEKKWNLFRRTLERATSAIFSSKTLALVVE